jgi:hypothetical protein
VKINIHHDFEPFLTSPHLELFSEISKNYTNSEKIQKKNRQNLDKF